MLQTQRRTWDETLPDGRSLADMIRQKLVSPTTLPAEQPGQQVRYSVPDQHGALPQPINPPTGGTPLPQPINAPTGGVPLAQTIAPAVPGTETAPAQAASTYDPSNTGTRPWKAGYGVGETDPLKRDAARIRAMIENPISKVNPDGSVETPHPMSKKRAALLGLLMGMGQAAQGSESPGLARVLAGGATGAIIGGVKPRAIQQWERRNEVGFEQGQLGQQQKTAKAQSELEDQQAQARQRQLAPELAAAEYARKKRYDDARVDIQKKVLENSISAKEADRKLRELDLEEKKLHNRTTEEISRNKPARELYDITLPHSGTVVRGNAGDAIAAAALGGKTTQARAAKIGLKESYINKAKAAEANISAKVKVTDKDGNETGEEVEKEGTLAWHIKKLEDGVASFPKPKPDDAEGLKAYNAQIASHVKQIADLKAKQEELRKEAKGYYDKATEAEMDAQALPEDTATVTQGTSYHVNPETTRAAGKARPRKSVFESDAPQPTVNTDLMPKHNFVVPKDAKGRKWSKSAFATAHPGVDVEAAAKEMARAGANVVN